MHKFTINDQNKKGGQLREWQLSLAGMKLQEIKSLEAIVFVPQLEEQGLNWNLLNPKLKALISPWWRVVQYLKKRMRMWNWFLCEKTNFLFVNSHSKTNKIETNLVKNPNLRNKVYIT